MKRFTETLKWAKPWFRQLEPKHKLLWQWMCDACDNAGVLDPDWGLASFQIGCPVCADDAAAFNGRVTPLPCGKIWIPSFIEFQVTTLSRECKAHGPIFTSLEKHGIDPETLSPIGYTIGYQQNANRVCNTLKEKEKEIEEEKEAEAETENPAAQKSEQPLTALQLAVTNLVLPSGVSRKPAPFTATEKRAMVGLISRLGEETILADIETMKRAKAKGWAYGCTGRAALINKWDSQVTMATGFESQAKQAKQLNPADLF